MLRRPLTVLATSFVLIAAAHAADAPKLVEQGSLTFGVAATFAPFEFQKDNKLTGFDIDMIDALSAKLKLKPKAMNMEFKGLIPALQGSRIDIINSAMYINPTRAEQVDFVPYLKIGNQVIVQTSNPKNITGRDNSICGTSVAVTLGAIEETYAREDDKRCKGAGKAAVNVLTFPTAQDAALSVLQGRADAFFDSTPGAVMLLEKVPGKYKTAGAEFESNTQIGMATRKGDAATKDLIEKGLKEIVADGTYKKLIEKWNLPPTVGIF
ncbi:MAG: ABC transporter substrate-binding protein [Proteobacteria bacterium]|nr:ABC transporter substrate-binding protein [Pseudomonadota bacterium]